jgi:hypothetical protein
MRPDPSCRILPRRALVAYTAVAAPIIAAVVLAVGSWLDGCGLPLLLVVAGQVACAKVLVFVAAVLSVPAIYGMVGRWPSLDPEGRLRG